MQLIGRSLGQYRIIEQIGAGGMATVYKAYQPGLDRFVAIKILPPQHAQNPGFKERFFREAKAVAQLSHPNILPVYDVGIEDDISYFAMKYVPDRTLRNIMGEHMPLPLVCRLIDQMASALDHAHERGIIHRDVKPANILLEGEWVLFTDFGIAKIVEETLALTVSGELLGTPAYMSPEQAAGKSVDHRSDIYSLGIVLFEMVTGQVPFKGETPYGVLFKHVHDSLPLPHSYRPDLPEAVEKTILKALAKDPGDRYEHAGSMALALHTALDENPVEKTLRATPVLGPPSGSDVATAMISSSSSSGRSAPAERTQLGIETTVARSPRMAWYILAVIGLLCLVIGMIVWVKTKGDTQQGTTVRTNTASSFEDRPATPEQQIPVTLTTSLSNAGWTINLQFTDMRQIKEVLYRFDNSREFRNMGHNLTVNPETGFPLPNTYFNISSLTPGEHQLEVKYRDLGNREHGPYMLSFDTIAETAKWVRHLLERISDSSYWVSFNKNLVYFTQLLSFKYGLKEIRYSINEPNLSSKLSFVPSPGDSTAGISDKDQMFFELPKNAESIYVQLVYLDGTESEVKRFPVKK
jgi:serine/threonine protein kinase